MCLAYNYNGLNDESFRAIDQLPVCYSVFHGTDRTIIDCNNQFAEMVGVQSSQASFVGNLELANTPHFDL